jgi:hypothetical protein
MKVHTEKKMPRNWHAVNAHFRKGGAIQSEKKEESKRACRDFKRERHNDWEQ